MWTSTPPASFLPAVPPPAAPIDWTAVQVEAPSSPSVTSGWDRWLPVASTVTVTAAFLLGIAALTQTSEGREKLTTYAKRCAGLYGGTVGMALLVTAKRAFSAACEEGCAKVKEVFQKSIRGGLLFDTAMPPVYWIKTCCEADLWCMQPMMSMRSS